MILQGPVGGPEIIASGLLADLLRVCSSLGARDGGHRHLMRSASSAGVDPPQGPPNSEAMFFDL